VILVDTSVWIDHFRRRDQTLFGLLENNEVLVHPFVIGEIALGHLRQRNLVLGMLHDLPGAVVASQDEVLNFIAAHKLFGLGIGYVDAHLLAATKLTENATLWTRDGRLLQAANRLAMAAKL
jgi:predicted nucleic acid-binding protein